MVMTFAAMELFPQTALTDSGSTTTPGPYKVVAFEGVITGLGSVITKPIVFDNYKNIYSYSIYFTKATDSVNVTVSRQDSWFSNKWDSTKTVLNAADSASIQYSVQDTTLKYPRASRFKVKGNTGNGYNVHFNGKAILKRE